MAKIKELKNEKRTTMGFEVSKKSRKCPTDMESAFVVSHLGKAGRSSSENPPASTGMVITKTRKSNEFWQGPSGGSPVFCFLTEHSATVFILSSQGIESSLSSSGASL